MRVRNTFIIFLVSGFWHGANWTFIIWGFLNALFIMPSIIFNTNRNNLEIVAQNSKLPNLRELFSIVSTFALTTFAWIFFRSLNIAQAINYIIGIFSFQTNKSELHFRGDLILCIVIFFLIEWMGRREQFALAKFGLNWNKNIRLIFYFILIVSLFWFGGKEQQFIYFDF
jgi:D-alanyl-lipoteichoic acid acyltransferase DltB (MBOAT superfamily)